MNVYELFLDESGNFEDYNSKKSPSLVGGYLIKEGLMSNEKAKVILGSDYAHNCEKDNRVDSLKVLNKLIDIGGKIVIFQNFERVNILKDRDLLYLNMVSEGILNLLDRLFLKDDAPIRLKVYIANRLDYSLGYENKIKINHLEYDKRIKERIYLKSLENDMFFNGKFEIDVSLASARVEQVLMIADVVCNTKLTIESNKFSLQERSSLKKIYQDSYVFNVFKIDTYKKYEDFIRQKNISNAIISLTEIDRENYNKYKNLLIDTINNMNEYSLNIQTELLSLKIRTLIEIYSNLSLAEKILIILQDEILPNIKIKDIYKLKLDVSTYLLTIYTHLGNNILSLRQIDISENILKNFNKNWDFLNYYYILNIRKAIMYSNSLLYAKALDILNPLIKNTIDIMEIIGCIPEFSSLKLDFLAKTVGTRLQVYTRMIKFNEKYYDMAIDDSNFAINEFTNIWDINRQYIYRIDVECMVNNYKEALRYLEKITSLNIEDDYKKIDFSKILNIILKKDVSSRNYLVCAYFEIMSVLSNYDIKIAEKMFSEFSKIKELNMCYLKNNNYISKYNDEIIERNSNKLNHPYEKIYYYLANYYKHININKAVEYFNNAINVCVDSNETTLRVSAFLYKLERNIMLNNIKVDVIINSFMNLYDENDSLLNEFLDTLKDDVLRLKNCFDIDKLLEEIVNKISI